MKNLIEKLEMIAQTKQNNTRANQKQQEQNNNYRINIALSWVTTNWFFT